MAQTTKKRTGRLDGEINVVDDVTGGSTQGTNTSYETGTTKPSKAPTPPINTDNADIKAVIAQALDEAGVLSERFLTNVLLNPDGNRSRLVTDFGAINCEGSEVVLNDVEIKKIADAVEQVVSGGGFSGGSSRTEDIDLSALNTVRDKVDSILTELDSQAERISMLEESIKLIEDSILDLPDKINTDSTSSSGSGVDFDITDIEDSVRDIVTPIIEEHTDIIDKRIDSLSSGIYNKIERLEERAPSSGMPSFPPSMGGMCQLVWILSIVSIIFNGMFIVNLGIFSDIWKIVVAMALPVANGAISNKLYGRKGLRIFLNIVFLVISVIFALGAMVFISY